MPLEIILWENDIAQTKLWYNSTWIYITQTYHSLFHVMIIHPCVFCLHIHYTYHTQHVYDTCAMHIKFYILKIYTKSVYRNIAYEVVKLIDGWYVARADDSK